MTPIAGSAQGTIVEKLAQIALAGATALAAKPTAQMLA
jgi:hypothetical protein